MRLLYDRAQVAGPFGIWSAAKVGALEKGSDRFLIADLGVRQDAEQLRETGLRIEIDQ